MPGSSVDFLINARMLLGGVPAFCPIPPPPPPPLTAIKSGYLALKIGRLQVWTHQRQRQGQGADFPMAYLLYIYM